MKKFTGLVLSFVLSVSFLAGCGNPADTTHAQNQNIVSTDAADSTAEASASETADNNQVAADTSVDQASDHEQEAKQLMKDLTGSYQELWPVILSDQYKKIWLDDCAAIVGEKDAQAAYEKLSSMVTGKVYGNQAVEAYKDGGGAYFCGFTQNLSTLKFDGENASISGYDKEDKELFSHTYHFIGMEETRGLYEFESDDADAGEFTYFYLAPDTSETTYHIEFRYGSDRQALEKYDEGAYAYWLASGISTEYDEAMISNCIQLFATENLGQ